MIKYIDAGHYIVNEKSEKKLKHIITITFIYNIMDSKMDKRIIVVLIVIIAILAIGLAYSMLSQNHDKVKPVNNTTVKNATLNNTTVKNATVTQPSHTESGKYGYCAICGRALSSSEANNEFTQGKVCDDCARNPYYQTEEGAAYANQKLFEAYPDEYDWMYDNPGSVEYDYSYNDVSPEEDNNYY